MRVAALPRLAFDNSFVRELEGLYVPWEGAPVAEPRLLALNEELVAELGVDPAALRADGGVDVLAGKVVPDGASPVAQAYAGHQFGLYSPRLGDGRALLLGEVLDRHGRRRDLHLRGDAAPSHALFAASSGFDAWAYRWREQLAHERSDPSGVASAMDRVNPVYIPRNNQVEEALAAATAGDLEPFQRLLDVLAHPFDERPGLGAYAAPAPSSWGPYRTFCGT
jgi:uncharacterized protein YdiU (UPF0061 family)